MKSVKEILGFVEIKRSELEHLEKKRKGQIINKFDIGE
jgi:hypothetical protein